MGVTSGACSLVSPYSSLRGGAFHVTTSKVLHKVEGDCVQLFPVISEERSSPRFELPGCLPKAYGLWPDPCPAFCAQSEGEMLSIILVAGN